MIELARIDDPVKLSWLTARLREAGIEAVVFDTHTSGLYAGMLDTVRCRVMVAEDDAARARAILREAPAEAP
ncbi:MAG: DUF2007 domain-containing protein [Hyphomicrobiales bacterium]|nr:DUF2007 domain-containing protein [Hyphomicrobiales bacterium]